MVSFNLFIVQQTGFDYYPHNYERIVCIDVCAGCGLAGERAFYCLKTAMQHFAAEGKLKVTSFGVFTSSLKQKMRVITGFPTSVLSVSILNQ